MPSAPSATCLMVVVITESGRATERAMMKTPTPTRASANSAKAGQKKSELAIGRGILGNSPAAFGVDLGQRRKIVIERHADVAIGFVVAPFAAGLVADLDGAANQLFSEFDELIDPLFEDGELLGVVRLDDGFPVLDDVKELVAEFVQPIAILLDDRQFRSTCRCRGTPSPRHRPAN